MLWPSSSAVAETPGARPPFWQVAEIALRPERCCELPGKHVLGFVEQGRRRICPEAAGEPAPMYQGSAARSAVDLDLITIRSA